MCLTSPESVGEQRFALLALDVLEIARAYQTSCDDRSIPGAQSDGIRMWLGLQGARLTPGDLTRQVSPAAIPVSDEV